MKRMLGCILAAGLLAAMPSLAVEETATSAFKILRNAKVKTVAPEFTGYVAVLIGTDTENYWFYIDPNLGNDGAKMLLSTALEAKARGASVNAVYWGTNADVKHDFQGLNWVTASRRLHTLYAD